MKSLITQQLIALEINAIKTYQLILYVIQMNKVIKTKISYFHLEKVNKNIKKLIILN